MAEVIGPNGPSQRPGHSPRHWLLFLLLVIGAAVLVIFLGWIPRHKQQEEIDSEAHERIDAKPKVQVVKISRAPSASELMIPGTTLAYTEAYIYARASGYLSRRLVDIGDRAHRGQLLAVIDAPDLDKQVAQARATLQQSEASLAQMQAQLHLSQLTWDRYKVLVAKGVFSKQDGDTQDANFRVAQANVSTAEGIVQANRDNLDRMIVLQQYERVTAPFDGVITARNVDVGALISAQGSGLGSTSGSAVAGTTLAGAEGLNAGASGALASSVSPPTGGSQGGQMFSIAALDPLRILVSVPEAYASMVKVGQKAQLLFQQISQEKFEGRVARSSYSIDQNTRTLLVEVQVRNPGGRLLPGMYAIVNFIDLKAQPPVLVPGESIVVRNGKNMVATLVDNNRIQFKPIQIGRDYGQETEITYGLKPGDVIAKSVNDQIQEGTEVTPEFPKETSQRHQQ